MMDDMNPPTVHAKVDVVGDTSEVTSCPTKKTQHNEKYVDENPINEEGNSEEQDDDPEDDDLEGDGDNKEEEGYYYEPDPEVIRWLRNLLNQKEIGRTRRLLSSNERNFNQIGGHD
uniref:Uncharacterized protein n=1 Tax=Cannabis sativa TaxID=3483 RepID=A0A803PHN1_CANSA